jgi:RNA polymerase sigma-70 factor (ECF subfamily)
MDEQQLIEGLKTGSDAAYRLAMHQYGGAMLAVARQINDKYAEDAVQEAWQAVFKSIHQFEERSSLKTWLITIAMRSTYNLLRKNKHWINIESIDQTDDNSFNQLFDDTGHWKDDERSWSNDSPDQILEAHAMKDCMSKLIQSLPEGQRLALVLTDFQSSTPDIICEALSVPTNHYRVLLHRARSRLYHMLNHFEQTGEC